MAKRLTGADRSKAIGDRIRAWREAQQPKWTVLELAKACRPEQLPNRITNYELGIRRMSLEAAEILATAMGTSAAHLLLLDDDQPVLTEDEAEVIKYLRLCPPEPRKVLIQRIRTIGLAAAPIGTDTAKVIDRLSRGSAKSIAEFKRIDEEHRESTARKRKSSRTAGRGGD